MQARADGVGGTWSAPSGPHLRDTTPPTISSRAPIRSSAASATFFFTPSEAGEYYFILTAADSAVPKAEDVVGSANAIHGACTAAEQAITLNSLSDAGAKAVFLVVQDAAGNRTGPNAYKITIPAYAAPTPTPTPAPTATPTPAPTATFGTAVFSSNKAVTGTLWIVTAIRLTASMAMRFNSSMTAAGNVSVARTSLILISHI